MESAVFKTLVQVESGQSKLPARPERAVSRTYPAAPHAEEDRIELQHFSPTRSSATTPRTEAAGFYVDVSRPRTPSQSDEVGTDGVGALQSVWDPYMNRFRLAACCLMNFLSGLNDSAPGALIPFMETYYNIGYAIVSLIFIGNAIGFITAAPCIDTLRARLGRAKTLALSQILMALAYVPIVCTAPFPVIVVSFFLAGFGLSLNLAIGNVFCANLANGTTMLGLMHGSYGVGGTIGPLIATAIVTAANQVWSRYYLLTLAFAAFNLGFATWSFWDYEKEAGPDASLLHDSPPGTRQVSAILAAFKSKIVLLGALFIFSYQGAEVSISGWVISFLISSRNGSPSAVGYVTSGFWGGITLGRFVLSPLGSKMGERSFVYACVVGATVFELLVWWVPNIMGDAVSLAIVGLLLGPVYPCAAAVFTRNLSRQEQVSGLGIISAFGSSGGAVAPFTTGILAQAVGTFVLHPIAIGLFTVMLGCWYGISVMRKRTE
ncbi:major facilitator superfamily domain-containing protein [Pseudomassariella vexata]|uniref:Major facilitator superfamily domain-containing protein n=1 Tax=Pseudomassariella vexata TaxID=1141098 RepID=A0A1Y2DUE1_9PEZI|nr:major facilitator superfamily domain-containing protein [Pseudomassariella vexata]ORY62893.1 major facilitator superfamily domain-containing protein [Pseudomassariella vexata]